MVKVNWTRNLALALTLFVLGTGAYWLEYKYKPEKEAKESQAKKIFQIKDTPVRSITVTQEGKKAPHFEFKCSDLDAKLCKPQDQSKWELSAPSQLKADDAHINSLLSALDGLSSTSTVDLSADSADKRAALLQEYGLDPLSRQTARKVSVTTDLGKSTLILGQSHPLGESIFAILASDLSGASDSGKTTPEASNQNPAEGIVNDTQVYLVPKYFESNLNHDLTYWRNKKLITLAAHEINQFELSGAKEAIIGERQDSAWLIESKGQKFAGDTDNIDNVLSSATYLVAKEFVSENKEDTKAKTTLRGASPVLKLTLHKDKTKDQDKSIVVSLFEKKLPGKGKENLLGASPYLLYAKVSNLDPLFELEPGALGRLNKGVKDLRQTKLITSADRFSAKKIEFSGDALGKTPILLENKEGTWRKAASSEEIESEKVLSLLEKLSGKRIKEFVRASGTEAQIKNKLQVTLSDEKQPRRQLIFWKKGDHLYAQDLLSGRKEVLLIDNSVRDVLPWEGGFFGKKKANKSEEKSDKTQG